VLEGVTFAIRDCRDALAATGTDRHACSAVGGGRAVGLLAVAIATALDVPIALPEAGDFGAAFGAARLGHDGRDGRGRRDRDTAADRQNASRPTGASRRPSTEGHDRYRAAQSAIRELT
jgi:xylulokinase